MDTRILRRIWIVGLMVAVALFGFVPLAAANEIAQETLAVPNREAALWSALVGAWLPPVISVINRYNWTSQTKGFVTFGVSVVAALGTSYFAGELAGGDIIFNTMIVLSAATASYHGFFKPTGISPSLEHRTG